MESSSFAIILHSVDSSNTTPSPVPISASASNILTIYNDKGTHVIKNNNEITSSSFNPGTIAITDNTTLTIQNGYIIAPKNGYKSDTEWPAIRLSIGSTLNAIYGTVTGSLATIDGRDGGEAIEIYNGQSDPETASVGYFYDGMTVIGGDAITKDKNGVGGNALHIHGFGTSVFIYGGTFRGGKGSDEDGDDDGLSVYTSNGGRVNVYSRSFEGRMEVGDSSVIAFYGCFVRNGTTVSGVFVDETNLSLEVRRQDGGQVVCGYARLQWDSLSPFDHTGNVSTLCMGIYAMKRNISPMNIGLQSMCYSVGQNGTNRRQDQLVSA